MDENARLLGIKELAEVLRRSPHTIAAEASRSPEKLPPRVRLPGTRRVLWLESDVAAWIKQHREAA